MTAARRPARKDDDDPGIFAEWQPRYAKHNIATFPVNISPDNKKPAIIGWQKVGLPGSAQLAAKFADHDAFGFLCGSRSGVTVVDMDDTDPAILREGDRLFGESPLVWQTGSGKFAAAYKFNGEPRLIRPFRDLPIDLLGGGFVVAPPSMGAKRRYEIIQGSLEDLDRLPIANIPSEIQQEVSNAQALRGSPVVRAEAVAKGQRDTTMFKRLLREVKYWDAPDSLLDAARMINMSYAPPMSDAQVVKIAARVWELEVGGRNWVGRKARAATDRDEILALAHNPYAAHLLDLLRVSHTIPGDIFAVDQIKTGKLLGWTRGRVRSAINALLRADKLEMTYKGGHGAHDAHRYRFR